MTGPEPVVYRIHDRSGRLIYIGATTNLEQRLANHRTQSWWYSLMDRVETEPHPTWEATLAAESAAIRAEQPAFNVAGSGRCPKRRDRLTAEDVRVCQDWSSAGGLLPMWLRWTRFARFASS